MSKTVKSPVGIFSGTVTLSEPMNYDQVRAIEDALDEGSEVEPSSYMQTNDSKKKIVWTSKVDKISLPAILSCVEKWELSNFPDSVNELTYPATPRSSANKLTSWLFSEIMKIYYGEIEVKNA